MNEVIANDLRNQLKELVKKELEQLPEYLNDMEPKERLEIVLKLMPFVLLKVKGVSHSLGEPFQTDW
jgi:hypothetical protein